MEEFPPPLDDPAVSGAGGDAPTDPPDGSDDPLPPPPNDADLPPPPPEEPTQLGQPAQELGQTDPVAAGSEVTGSKPDDEVPGMHVSHVCVFWFPRCHLASGIIVLD